MAELMVPNLEDDVRDKLKALAQSHGRSLEEEVRDILRGAVEQSPDSNLGTRIANRFSGNGLEQEVAELRGHTLTPPSFQQ